jgi:hypothetical protein
LRASELRGLRWVNVDLRKRELHVRDRADEYNQLGRAKSGSGERSVPLTPMVVSAVRKWKLQCPKGKLGLVFPTPKGKVQGLSIIVRRGFVPAQIVSPIAAPPVWLFPGCINRSGRRRISIVFHFWPGEGSALPAEAPAEDIGVFRLGKAEHHEVAIIAPHVERPPPGRCRRSCARCGAAHFIGGDLDVVRPVTAERRFAFAGHRRVSPLAALRAAVLSRAAPAPECAFDSLSISIVFEISVRLQLRARLEKSRAARWTIFIFRENLSKRVFEGGI